ncbi:PREDICTED: arrestin domain-containing protein 3-like [Branchiostoma belcheri]|uniref:Arrestin domain-containing protein 3-like n=1 Tax=Branchiostoma belcheri TaxID=7741 RepID=A0A6P4ZSQ4_BRABE|nr:PREDICTED: arrestin domain-containing protein 3-like [Branchiostoma belcheri]
MGKLQEFSIQFANNMDVFMPGQWVTGQVVVDLSDEMKMRAIELTFKGKGHVEWRENQQVQDGGEPEQEEVRYWADEEFLDREITVLGKDESGDNRTLDAGHHVFPFQYQLPQDGLPTSFEGAHGYIRYSVIGKIDKPWKFDHKTKRAFTVLDMVDLNQQPTAMTPLRGQESKTLCCLCCASGPIELQVMAERSAYCPGELINIKGSLENNSSSRITKVKARLKQEVVYNADHPEHKPRPITKDLGTAEEGGCEEGGTVDLNLTLPVPAVPPSNLRYCSLINLTYKLDVSAHFDGAHTSMELSFPILIGSIPLRSIYPTPPAFPPPPVPPGFDAAYPPPNPGAYPPPNPGAYPPPNPGGSYPPGGPDAVYPPPAPASYMQSVFGESNIRDDDDNEYIRGTLNYAPKYPYYNWSQHPQI